MRFHLLYILFIFPLFCFGQGGTSLSVRVSLVTDGCEYSSARFSASVSGSDAFECSWFRVGEVRDISLGKEDFLEISSLSLMDTGDYYCIVTNLNTGEFIKSSITRLLVTRLKVSLPPFWSVSEKDKFTLYASDETGNSLPVDKLKWYVNGQLNKTANNFTASANDMHIRVVYQEGTCAGIDSTYVFVKPRRLFRGGNEDGFARVSLSFQVEINVPSEYCVNQELAFKASAKGDAGSSGFTFRWWKVGNGYDRLVAERQNFFLAPSVASDAGDYYCEVRDQNGFTVFSDTQKLILNPVRVSLKPELFYATQSEVLEGEVFHTSGIAITNDSLSWSIRPVGISRWTDCQSNHFSAGATDSYIRAVYTNSKGCIAEDSSLVISRSQKYFLGGIDDGFAFSGAGFTVIRLLPTAKIQEFCEGGSVLFRATVIEGNDNQYRFRWWRVSNPTNELLAESADFSLSGLQSRDAGYYFCEARDSSGFSAFTDTVRLTAKRVVLPSVLHAFSGERLSLTAKDILGSPVVGSLTWRPSGIGTSNPLAFTAPANDMLVRVTCDFGDKCVASDSTWVYIHDRGSVEGGDGDGFARTKTFPALTKPRLPRFLCTLSDSMTIEIGAVGSDLSYAWEYFPVVAGVKPSPSAKWNKVGDLGFPVIGADDFCLTLLDMPENFVAYIRCKVSNSLATIYSDTLHLYGHHLLQASVDKSNVTLYSKKSDTVTVSLAHGIAPWTYYYTSPLNTRYQRVDMKGFTDRLTVGETGLYRLDYLKDSVGCEVWDSLPVIKVSRPEIPEITISGDKEICEGLDALLHFEIINGVGPWQIWVDIDGVTSSDPGINWPLTVYRRDTSILFKANTSGVYTVRKLLDMNGGNGSNPTEGVTDGAARIVIHTPDIVRFTPLTDNHVGTCRTIDLLTLLKPLVNDRPHNAGTFYVNGALTGGAWKPVSGEYTVRYVQNADSYGCSGNTELVLIGDPLPGAFLDIPKKDICINSDGQAIINTVGNDVFFKLEKTRFDWQNNVVNRTTFTVSVSLLSDNNYTEAIRFVESDSCLIYKVYDITDKHGCKNTTVPVIDDMVYNRLNPEIRIQTRYPDLMNKEWASMAINDTLYTWGEAVRLQSDPCTGIKPFDIQCDKLPDFNGSPTIISDSGVYNFQVQDRYCFNADAGKFIIFRMQPLYLRLKLLLEGMNGIDQSKNISVELYQNHKIVAIGTGKVSGDGSVTAGNGRNILSTKDFTFTSPLSAGNYEIVVRSDGYLPVRSKKAYLLSMDSGRSPLIDFTDGDNVFIKSGELSSHMTKIGNRDGKDIWALSAVEGNRNELISVKDINTTIILPARFTISGDETGLTRKNRDKYSEVE